MSAETVEVRFAPPSLAPCVVCCIWRHVDAQCAGPVNARVPANIYACVNLVLQGRVESITKPGGILPDFFVTGPFTRPLATASAGPLHSVSLVIQPWLLRAWFGWAPAELIDALQDLRTAPAAEMAGPLHRALLAAASGPAAAERLWEALHAISDPAARLAPPLSLQELLQDGVAAAARALGLGERQYERRFGLAMGVPPRTWLRIRRLESALVALAGDDTGAAALAQLAAETGFADQAHLTRAFRA
ncbi:MAG TPA: AraC family transcriptional regulator, partial [Ramlibacter sp.]|nr:AraC family transcriptional regulator [Ramlibacter sp.]